MSIIEKQEKLRNILVGYGCEEYGDVIIDDICLLFNFPTTVDFEAMLLDDSISFEEIYYKLKDDDSLNWEGLKDIPKTKQELFNALKN